MKDKEILENIKNIAHGLLGYNKGHKCFTWGEYLYDIHKYLESRLTSGDTIRAEIKKPLDIAEDFQGIFTNCHIDRVILTVKDSLI